MFPKQEPTEVSVPLPKIDPIDAIIQKICDKINKGEYLSTQPYPDLISVNFGKTNVALWKDRTNDVRVMINSDTYDIPNNNSRNKLWITLWENVAFYDWKYKAEKKKKFEEGLQDILKDE
jgi:hypothetical protein